ncbi:fungal-specific transcription factor domain-containing protein [Ilyonectria robusta]|uniref:fungal-specific transcription factor domain-containing protein n=1 Tax=Ilyonectria robusta TaxID=1079257 RepID=UPI001E8CEB9B|nr:fungal-specific transcription factor domain-containing protein [Ilyonectria robusta]KAH8683587.1 fungal-specific transcription factor domain-containing protein [Ilyonectria robusta]
MPPYVNRGRIGCWTCRIRHRKCDELFPTCKECSSRGIPCYGYESKPPAWMNDPRRLDSELQNIKRTVKENFRRIRRLQNRSSPPHVAPTSRVSEARVSQTPTVDPEPALERVEPAPSENTSFREAQHIVHYLDYIFPLQYPYYVDDPDLGGRGWLFWLLTKSAPLRQAALTLSALHQHIVSHYRAESQESELIQYHTKALQELRQVLSRREVEGFASNREEWVEFMAGGLALISFQVFQGGTSNWEPHVSALGSILAEPTPSELQLQPAELKGADSELVGGIAIAQRFQVANLLWFDILACTSTGSQPRTPYRQWLNVQEVDMSRVMGCQNWMMIIIGDIASLGAEGNSYEPEALHSNIEALEARIHYGLDALDLEPETISTRKSRLVTRIFATTALVQLYTIPGASDIITTDQDDAIAKVIDAIENLPKDVSLRGLTWSMCVVGCLARPHQQPFFENILEGILTQSDSAFSNCKTVLRIIQHCWNRHRDSLWTPRLAMVDMGICALLV